MKLLRYSSLNIKYIISLFAVILFVFIINCQGICQMQGLAVSKDNQEKSELTETKAVNVVPYTKGSSESQPQASDPQKVRLDQTVQGLKEAEYSLDQITTVLKNDNNEPAVISIACLKQGYSGDQVFKALIKTGFSKSSAESAVPSALRNEAQFLTINTDISQTSDVNIANTETVMLKEKKSASPANNGLEVPVSVGITFNGLGNWGDFQDNRFKTEK
jgi:hypothetical protein